MPYLYLSSLLAVIAAIAHSYIGEAKIFRPMFAEAEHIGVMKSLGLRRVTRAVWHLPSLCWALMAAMTLILARQSFVQESIQATPMYFAAAVYFLSGAGNFIATRGKHFGWIVLVAAAALVMLYVNTHS